MYIPFTAKRKSCIKLCEKSKINIKIDAAVGFKKIYDIIAGKLYSANQGKTSVKIRPEYFDKAAQIKQISTM